MRIARTVAITAAALVAIVALGVIALLLFVDPNRYRGDIERLAQQHTGRALTIQGKLGLKVFPWLAVSVEKVQLGNAPGFGTEPFATVRNASIGVKLLPLLAKRLEVSRIAIDGLSVDLVTRGDRNNWQDLSESKGPVAQPSPASSSQGAGYASIEGVEITNASLLLRDETKQSTTRLSDLQVHSGQLSSSPSGAELQSLVIQGHYLSQSGPPQPDQPAGAQPVTADTQPLAFAARIDEVRIDSKAQTLAPAKIELKVGATSMLLNVAGEKISTDRSVSGTLEVPKTSARQLLQALGTPLPATRDSQALSAFALLTNFKLTKQQLRLTNLRLTLDDTQVQGSAAIEDLDTSALTFDLDVNQINLDRYRAPEVKAPAAKPVARTPPPAKEPTPLPLETLRKLDVQGTLRVHSAIFAALTFQDVTMPLTARDGHIHLGPTSAHLYGGAYNGDIVLDARPVQAQLSLNEHVRGTDIGALVKAAFASDRISGSIDANVAVTGVGNTDDALMRSLSGKIDANVKQGAINGIALQFELQRVNSLLKRETPPQQTGPARTPFNTLLTTDTLDNGTLHTDDLQIETDFLKIHGRGTLDLATEALDYQLVASVSKSPPSQGGRSAGSGLDALQALDVPLTITGTLASPTVRPDVEALAKGQLGKEVQQKAGDLVKKKLGDKLKDLFGH
jgi:AsmA protein